MNDKGKGREKRPGNPQGLSRWALARKRRADIAYNRASHARNEVKHS